jgi:hypothetical protein
LRRSAEHREQGCGKGGTTNQAAARGFHRRSPP